MNRFALPLLTSLFVLTASAQVQPAKSVDRFLDIAWGTPAADAKKMMAARPGVKFKRDVPGATYYSGGSFDGKPTNTFVLHFTGGRFFQGDAYLNPVDNRKAIYDSMKRSLTAKYGAPTHTGNGGLLRWTFPVTQFHKNSEIIEMALTTKHNEVRVSYVNESLAKPVAGESDDL